jgi:hypothetical protein
MDLVQKTWRFLDSLKDHLTRKTRINMVNVSIAYSLQYVRVTLTLKQECPKLPPAIQHPVRRVETLFRHNDTATNWNQRLWRIFMSVCEVHCASFADYQVESERYKVFTIHDGNGAYEWKA